MQSQQWLLFCFVFFLNTEAIKNECFIKLFNLSITPVLIFDTYRVVLIAVPIKNSYQYVKRMMGCTTCSTISCMEYAWCIAHCKFLRLVHTAGGRFVVRLTALSMTAININNLFVRSKTIFRCFCSHYYLLELSFCGVFAILYFIRIIY